MKQGNNLTTQPINSAPLGKRMLLGATIALILISFFLLQVKHPNPAWGELWMIRPLIIVPLAGAMGGLFYHIMNHLRIQRGWNRIFVNIVSLMVYIIGLWLGIILGLDGTLWN